MSNGQTLKVPPIPKLATQNTDLIPIPAETKQVADPHQDANLVRDPADMPPPKGEPSTTRPGFFERAWEWVNTPLVSEEALQSRASKEFHKEKLRHIGAAHPIRAGIAAFGAGAEDTIARGVHGLLTPATLGLAALSFGESLYGKIFATEVAGAVKAAKLPLAARIPVRATQVGATAAFGGQAAVSLATPQQPGETKADVLERKLMSGGQLSLAAAGGYAQVKDSVRGVLRKSLKLSDNLAEKVTANLDKINEAKTIEAKKTGAIKEDLSAQQRAIEAKKSQSVQAAEGILEHNMAALEGQTGARMSNIERSTAAETAQLEEHFGAVDKEKAESGRQILADTAQVLFKEHARVQQPFVEIGNDIASPVTDTASVRAVINEELLAHGVKETELPSSATAALGKATSAETTITWFGEKIPLRDLDPKAIENLKVQGVVPKGENVTFNDLTRVKDDLYRSAQKATDGALKASLFSAAEKISDLQEAAAEKAGFGEKYKKAKADYMKFIRGVGSSMVTDWLSARDVEDQALAPKLAKLTNRANAEALRVVFKEMGIETSGWDKAIAELKATRGRLKELPKERTGAIRGAGTAESERGGIERREAAGAIREARAGAREETRAATADTRLRLSEAEREASGAVKVAEAKGAIIPGKTTSELAGISNEDLLRARMAGSMTEARAGGIQHPGAVVMMVYGLLELAAGKKWGAFALTYGLAREGVPGLSRNKAFQDWVIRKAGVEPSDKLLTNKLRKGIASLYPILRQAAKGGVAPAVVSGAQRPRPPGTGTEEFVVPPMPQ